MIDSPETRAEFLPDKWFPIFKGIEVRPAIVSQIGEKSWGFVSRIKKFGYGEVILSERKAVSLPMAYFNGEKVTVYDHSFQDGGKIGLLFEEGLVGINCVRNPKTRFSHTPLKLHLRFGQDPLIVVHDSGGHWKDFAKDSKYLNGFWTIAALDNPDVLNQIQGLYGDLQI